MGIEMISSDPAMAEPDERIKHERCTGVYRFMAVHHLHVSARELVANETRAAHIDQALGRLA